MNSIEITDVPRKVSSQEELVSEYDSIRAYHGTTHRFRDSIRGNGLVPRNYLFQMEKPKSEEPLVFFGSESEEDMNPPNSECHSAEDYGTRTLRNTIGGKSMVVKAELPIENLRRDDVATVDERGIENVYESIVNYGVVAHRDAVSTENIIGFEEKHNIARPPENVLRYQKTEHYSIWLQAVGEQDLETLKEIGEDFESQVEPREFQRDNNPLTAEELFKEVWKN